MRFSTRATSRTAAQIDGPEGLAGRDDDVDDPTETTEVRPNWARLKASLTDRWRRLTTSASRGADEAGGDERRRRTRKSPATSGSSLIENEWALRPMWRWMTFASAR